MLTTQQLGKLLVLFNQIQEELNKERLEYDTVHDAFASIASGITHTYKKIHHSSPFLIKETFVCEGTDKRPVYIEQEYPSYRRYDLGTFFYNFDNAIDTESGNAGALRMITLLSIGECFDALTGINQSTENKKELIQKAITMGFTFSIKQAFEVLKDKKDSLMEKRKSIILFVHNPSQEDIACMVYSTTRNTLYGDEPDNYTRNFSKGTIVLVRNIPSHINPIPSER